MEVSISPIFTIVFITLQLLTSCSSKHMDTHDRPYKCEARGCENRQGFTYSGGLVRHEREVHKIHGDTTQPLLCPHGDCKRSVGRGFTRKENLAEHVRRVHVKISGKSKRPIKDIIEESEDEADLRSEIKRLRRDIETKDERLQKLEVAVEKLLTL